MSDFAPADVSDIRVRISEYGPKLVQVVIAIVGFFAVTMLSDIRGELRDISSGLQDLVVRTAGVEQRVTSLEGSTLENRQRIDRMDADVRDFWRQYGGVLDPSRVAPTLPSHPTLP